MERAFGTLALRACLVSAVLASPLPIAALLTGAAVAVGCAALLYFGEPLSGDAGIFGAAFLLAACLGVVVGVALVVMGASDWRTAVEVTGPILRLRTFGDEDDRRYYIAVDDGSSDAIRAWRVKAARYEGLAQGESITARLTRHLCCVRWVLHEEGPSEAGVGWPP